MRVRAVWAGLRAVIGRKRCADSSSLGAAAVQRGSRCSKQLCKERGTCHGGIRSSRCHF
ncbi:hypothetical protein FKM82_001107 [Ascaphus truei]